MSFKSEVIADSSGQWVANGCAYATREEADHAGRELAGRWFAVRDTRVVESTDPVNYRFNLETYRSERIRVCNCILAGMTPEEIGDEPHGPGCDTEVRG